MAGRFFLRMIRMGFSCARSTPTRVIQPKAPSFFEAMLGAKRSFGTSLPVAAGPGAVVSASFCGGRTPLVFAGPVASVCG